MLLRNLVVQLVSKFRAGFGLSIAAALALSAACTDLSNLPFISEDDGGNEEVSLKIEPAATSVAPGNELPLVISASQKDGSPVKDGTVITLQNDGLGQVVPTSTTTVGGKASAKFVAGKAGGSSTIKAESSGGAKHEVTVKIDANAPPVTAPGNQTAMDDIPAASITWAEADISAWKTTATITSLSVNTQRRRVYMTTTTKDWPQLAYPSGPGGMGNWWMIAKVDGAWHAATYEWLGVGRTQTGFPEQFDSSIVDPKRLRGKLANWVPKKGETVGFCQSTFARDRVRTTNERTNIKTVTWPAW